MSTTHIEQYYSIVVSVPTPRPVAFIAVPFSEEFRNIQDSIVTAVTATGLTPKLLNLNPDHAEFLKGIFEHTREATIVIAVCSPETTGGYPNPNVMYELGLAHSIGKSTVILTSDISLLPADLRARTAVTYSPGKENSKSFVNRLEAEIHRAKDRVKDRLIENGCPDVSVARARHRIVLNPEAWDCFIQILSAAKDVHHYFQDLDTSYVDSLFSPVDEIVNNPSAVSFDRENEIQKAWYSYAYQYDRLWTRFLSQHEEICQRVNDSFEKLNALSDTATQPLLDESHRFFDTINTDLEEFPIWHDRIREKFEGQHGLSSLLRDSRTTQSLWVDLTAWSRISKRIVTIADSAIQNLVQVIK